MPADAVANVRLIKVVAVSPGDVAPERERLETVIAELDRDEVLTRSRVLRLWRWETHARPGLDEHGPQGLIDGLMRMDEADIVVGIFWKRFGTPTDDAGSGTEHELRRAWALWEQQRRPDVLLYFCQRSFSPSSQSEVEQRDRVLAFRKSLPAQQTYWEYAGVDEFERKVREHLRGVLATLLERRTPKPGFDALATRLRVRVENSSATFEVDGEPVKVHEVTSPGATLGRGEDVDLRLVGPATVGISRRHLLLRPLGRRWTVTDCDTTNRTHEEDPDSGNWRDLPIDVPVPVEDGMLLCLGSELLLRFEVAAVQAAGGMTPELDTGPVRIRPSELEEVALALLAPRRGVGGEQATPSTKELAVRLGRPRAEIKQGLRRLRALPRVKALEPKRGADELAGALERAFPYLLGLPAA